MLVKHQLNKYVLGQELGNSRTQRLDVTKSQPKRCRMAILGRCHRCGSSLRFATRSCRQLRSASESVASLAKAKVRFCFCLASKLSFCLAQAENVFLNYWSLIIWGKINSGMPLAFFVLIPSSVIFSFGETRGGNRHARC